MYRPSEGQQAQMDRVVAAVRRTTTRLGWDVAELSRGVADWLTFEHGVPPHIYEPLAREIEAELEPQQRAFVMGDVLRYPAALGPKRDPASEVSPEDLLVERLTLAAAAQWVVDHFSEITAHTIGTHLLHWVAHPEDWAANRRRGLPGLAEYLELLYRLADCPQALPIVVRLLTGKDMFISAAPSSLDDEPLITRGSYDGIVALERRWFDFLRRLHAADRLTYDVFRSAAVLLRLTFQPELLARPRPQDPFQGVLWDYQREFLARWSQDITEENAHEFIEIGDFWGTDSLLKACGQIEKLGVRRVRFGTSSEGVERALLSLANLRGVNADTDLDALVGALKKFRPDTLEIAYPIAGAAQHAVLKARGWESLRPLRTLVREIADQNYLELAGTRHTDVPNCDDPLCGVVDRRRIRSIVEAIDAQAAERMLQSLCDARVPGMNAAMLVAAAAGFNRRRIEEGLKRRQQIATKAFGLLPLDNGDDEVLARYILLRRMEREARPRGPGQWANVRAAVQAALANLAQTASYPDAARLEWAMEGRMADRCTSSQRTVGAYQLRLDCDGRKPKVIVQKQDRALKTTPSVVRRSAAYRELRELADSHDDQVQRFSQALETLMVQQEWLAREFLARLAALPVAANLLGRLVLSSQEGTFGMLHGQNSSFAHLDGERLDFAGPLRIAHSYDLFQAGVLPAWQQRLVRRQVVQPFKQVFRELYVLTQAEKESNTFSARFAGHSLDARMTAALLRSRGWRGGKSPARQGLYGVLRFDGMGHFLSETEFVTSGCVYFVRQNAVETDNCDAWVPLSTVPAIAFSETMRDVDLFVSVAQRGGQAPFLSPETRRSRAELVMALVAQLGIDGVTLDGHFVCVAGRLARYRIHLSSAAIHIEPGSHLCIVPQRTLRSTEPFYLPFADVCDPKSAELISKILLLANDDRIDDPMIVSQIEAAREGRGQ